MWSPAKAPLRPPAAADPGSLANAHRDEYTARVERAADQYTSANLDAHPADRNTDPTTNTPLPPTDTPIPPTDTPVPTILRGSILYTEGENNTAEIVVIDANGQNRQQITNNNQYEGEPDWSPDESRIAYEATIGIDTDIYTMAANGSDVRRMTTTGQPNRHPDWSPDGALITYESGKDETSEVYVVNADGSGHTRLTNNAFGDRAPKFSPDGTKIAYMTHQRNKWEIAIMAYPGGNQLSLFNCPAVDCRFPAWTSSGDKIAYNTLDAQGPNRGYGYWTSPAGNPACCSSLKMAAPPGPETGEPFISTGR